MMVLAIAALIVFLYVPYGHWDIQLTSGNEVLPQMVALQQPVMLWFTVLTGVVILCSIFLYNKLPLQKSLVALSAVMVLAMVCVVIYNLTRPVDIATAEVASMTPQWGIGGLMLVAAFVALVAAYRGISRDQKLLRSYNSLR